MPRGQEDGGQYAAKEVSASVSDMGEVAARLGSIVTYDKRGDVVDFDNFEEPVLRWFKAISGAGIEYYLDTSAQKSGSQSVYTLTGTTVGNYVRLEKAFSLLGSTALGIEFSFYFRYPYNICFLSLNWVDSSYSHLAKLKIGLSNEKLYVLNSDNEYTLVGNIKLGGYYSHRWYTVKLVADFTSLKYKRVLFTNVEYDLSTIALYTESGDDQALITQIQVERSGGLVSTAFNIDDVIWTQAEP